MSSAASFLEARDLLLAHRDDYQAAYAGFRWPEAQPFNWGLDYFDPMARGNERPALWIVDEAGDETRLSFGQLSERSNRVANYLRGLGARAGDRLLTLLPNVAPLWEVTLACLKLGAVVSPAATLLTAADLLERVERGGIRYVVTDTAGLERCAGLPAAVTRIVAGAPPGPHAQPYDVAQGCSGVFVPDGPTAPDQPFLLYFTSGTTAKPKMVLHTQRSYPIGHLSTMYWIGLRPGDVHWNISSPGWAKHAWSSFFAPWNAAATVFIFNQTRFDAGRALAALARYPVTTLCAPPTVWRMLILEDLAAHPVRLREAVSAGEPLNPEIIERVRQAWGVTLRDGYGQTETTALVGNTPGQPVKPGAMGRPLPGYHVQLLDSDDNPGAEGEVAVALQPRPAGLMQCYLDNAERSADLLGGAYYRAADVARRDEDGYLWYVGRADDVFKSSDYRISPFEIESALLEHEAVAEAAVVPSPDALRLAVPKAFIVLRPGVAAGLAPARSLFAFVRQRLAPYQRVRRIEFGELPKTLSGKIRRVELRRREAERGAARFANEFWEEDVAPS
ncbi:MAG: AMP-binding protein [Gemmataceae bacterium]